MENEPHNPYPEMRVTPWGVLLRAASFILAWWAFTEGDWKEWPVAVVVIVAATISSLHILPLRSWDWKIGGFLRFAPYFLAWSLWGGLDVIWRAFHPNMPLNPALQTYHTRLPGELPRVFLAWTVSLMPGTASISLEEDRLIVHVLNNDDHFMERMRALENRIAPVFGIADV